MMPNSWKEALHESFYRSSRPLKAIADELGVSRQYLQAAADEAQPDAHLSGRHFPALAHAADNLAWLDYLERQADRVAYPIPRGQGQIDASTGRAIESFGQLIAQIGDAHTDGVITQDEAQLIRSRGRQVLTLVAGLLDTIDAAVTPETRERFGARRARRPA